MKKTLILIGFLASTSAFAGLSIPCTEAGLRGADVAAASPEYSNDLDYLKDLTQAIYMCELSGETDVNFVEKSRKVQSKIWEKIPKLEELRYHSKQ